VVERSIVFDRISRHHHTEFNPLRCAFLPYLGTSHLFLHVYLMDRTPVDEFHLEQQTIQKSTETLSTMFSDW
jgi:hypothetical protein